MRHPPSREPSGPPARRNVPPRADLGAPIDGFIASRPPDQRAILEALQRLVEEAAPDAGASLKWGMPCFTVGGKMMCSLGAHRAHVNLVLFGSASAFTDPDGRLEGEGKGGRHLKLRSVDEIPIPAVRGWLRTAAALAREGAA